MRYIGVTFMNANSSIFNNEISPDELAKLIKDAKRHRGEALNRLCKFVYKKIFGYTYYRVQQREDAEDLTSEVILKMVRSLKTQHGNFLAWIYRIANNTIIDFYRRRSRRPEISIESLKQDLPGPELAKDILTENSLRKALNNLTPDQAQVITLRFLQDYTNQEVAQIMGKTVGAVKVIQYRALKALKEYLAKEAYATKN